MDGKADDVGKVGQQKRRQEPILDEDALSECKPLTKRLLKRSTRIASKMDFIEPAEPTGKAVGKKQHDRSKMPITGQKAIYSEELSAPEDGRLVVEEATNHKDKVDASYSKQLFGSSKKKREANGGKIGANRQHGSFEASTINSAKGDGTADDVGKVRQQERRKEPILDEDASLNDCKPLTKSPLKRSTHIASKMGFVEPAKPTGIAVKNGKYKMPIKEQKALYSQRFSASERGRLSVAADYKNKVNGYIVQVFESSKKKRQENGREVGVNKQHGFFEASTVNSATEEAADTTVNLEENSVSTLVKLPFVSSPSNQSGNSGE